MGDREVGFVPVILEAEPGDCISHTKLLDTYSGVVTLDYPESTRQNGEVQVQVSGVFCGKRVRKYLIHHVNK